MDSSAAEIYSEGPCYTNSIDCYTLFDMDLPCFDYV